MVSAMDIATIHLRADHLFRVYLDARLGFSLEGSGNAHTDTKLAYFIGSRAAAGAPAMTRAELRDEIVRIVSEETKVDTAAPPEQAESEMFKVRQAMGEALGKSDDRPLVDLVYDLAEQRDALIRECNLRTLSGDGVRIKHDTAYVYSGRWARACKVLGISPDAEMPTDGPAIQARRVEHAARWVWVCSVLGISAEKDPPIDIAGFIDWHGF